MAKRGRKDCDEQLLLALAAGASVAVAASQAQCSERTVRRRLADPGFRQRVSETRGELVQAAVGRLSAIGSIAADELLRLIKSGDSDQVKLGAARAVLTHMLSGHGNEVLARQVEELRKQIEALEHGSGNDSEPGEAAASSTGATNSQGGADPGAGSSRPGSADGESGLPAGPLAEGAPDEDIIVDIPPMFG
jgi:hypothetical protein